MLLQPLLHRAADGLARAAGEQSVSAHGQRYTLTSYQMVLGTRPYQYTRVAAYVYYPKRNIKRSNKRIHERCMYTYLEGCVEGGERCLSCVIFLKILSFKA